MASECPNAFTAPSTKPPLTQIHPHTYRAMQHYLLLGLELGLYSTGESDQVLWYLDCLLTIRCES